MYKLDNGKVITGRSEKGCTVWAYTRDSSGYGGYRFAQSLTQLQLLCQDDIVFNFGSCEELINHG